jgi:oxygen-independent coproporphyrinogen-3 oxidase
MQVYIHYPYCATLCPYCDFFSTTADEDPGYKTSARKELTIWSRFLEGPVTSIYFGGGTPGRMAPSLCATLIDDVDKRFGLSSSAEITLETNPDDVTEQGIRDFLAAGVNRLSIGVQSLNDEELKMLGRRHDSAAAITAVAAARAAGVKNLSLDLIFGLPNQSESGLKAMLERFFSLQPEHVSLYGLTIEEGTQFGVDLAAGRFTELERNTWLRMYDLVSDAASSQGLERYEISNFAHPGRCSRHNRSYWRDGNFVAIGPGAHGQRRLASGGLQRRFNPRSVKGWRAAVEKWSDADEFAPHEELSPQSWLREACMVGLRDLHLGIDPQSWAQSFNLADETLMATVRRLVECGDLSAIAPHRLLSKAMHRADAVAAELLNA